MKSITIRPLVLFAIAGLLPGLSVAQKPLKVFLLVGQSNMQGHAHVRTLDHLGMDPNTAPLLKEIRSDDGKARISENVWISYLSAGGEKQGKLTTGFGADENKIGPELTFGIYTQKLIDQPILIIKTAWGGKSLHTDFRPPNAGPYVFNESEIAQFKKQNKDINALKTKRDEATGHYYRQMIQHVRKTLADIKTVYPNYDARAGYELAGFVWFQGWNDMVGRSTYPNRDKPGGYDQYSEVLAKFIRNVRKDLDAPDLPFVVGVMGAGGPVDKYLPGQKRYAGVHQNFRDAMAAPANMPEFKGNVVNVLTENYWDMELTGLRAREAKIKTEVKKLVAGGELERKEERAEIEKRRAKEFTERELKTLEVGVSNAEYHYLGSAKILAQIGKAFAEALHEMAGV